MDLKVKDPPTNHLNSGWEDNSTHFRKHERPTKCTGSKDRYDKSRPEFNHQLIRPSLVRVSRKILFGETNKFIRIDMF